MSKTLDDVELEERLLGMMMHGTNVRSLTGAEFTSPERKTIYLLLKNGEKAAVNHQHYYVSDLRKMPEIPRNEIPVAIADLKRLHKARLVEAEMARLLARLHKVDSQTLNGLLAVLERVGVTNPDA